MWLVRKKRKPARRKPSALYTAHKEATRSLVFARLAYYNEHYQFSWNRIAIRDTKRSWGSCTSLKNLNFNYKLLFLPPHLQDYIIVHELCHLEALHHGESFWQLVGETVPAYKECVAELKHIDRTCGGNVRLLKAVQASYHARPIG